MPGKSESCIPPLHQTVGTHALTLLHPSQLSLTYRTLLPMVPPTLQCVSADISGTVPESLRDMRELLQLDLEINKLAGSLNQGQLCQYDNNSLKLLLIR